MTLARPALLALLLAGAAPVLAADPPPVGPRVDRLEKEMRAVQRKVFPGGTPAFSEPEIAAPEPASAAGTPAGQPLDDLTARVAGVERELARITNQLEQDEHRLTLLSDQSAKDRAEFNARLKAIEAPAAPATGAAPPPDQGAIAAPAPRPGRAGARPPAARPPEEASDLAAPAPAGKLASGDAAEDGYMAGYQLWTDKRYAEAEAQLAKVAKQYPKHRRASYARNLLGRAQLDEGKPATAAQTFLENYQADPRGERAADSLFYLGQSLAQLKKTDNACRAYAELQDVYGATMAASLKAKIPDAQKAAGCKAASAG